MSTTTTLETLDRGLWTHLRAYPLPEPVSVGLVPTMGRAEILPGGGLDDLAHLGELLLWAYTLEQVTACWWHTPDQQLHVTIEGRTSGEITIRVFGSIAFAACVGLVPLAAGEKEGVSLDELHALRELLCEQQTGTVPAGGAAA